MSYNNWLLGPWLNYILFKANGSISEFSIATQPHSLVFKSLDILSGLLLVTIAYLFAEQLGKGRWGRVLIAATAVLGIANIADALAVLPCSETLNPSCYIPVSISLNHYAVPVHAYSSTVISVCYFLLPAAGLIYSLKNQLKLATIASLVLIADSLFALASAVANYLSAHSLTVRTSGVGQELEMLILGMWIVVFYACLLYRLRSEAGIVKSKHEQ